MWEGPRSLIFSPLSLEPSPGPAGLVLNQSASPPTSITITEASYQHDICPGRTSLTVAFYPSHAFYWLQSLHQWWLDLTLSSDPTLSVYIWTVWLHRSVLSAPFSDSSNSGSSSGNEKLPDEAAELGNLPAALDEKCVVVLVTILVPLWKVQFE